MDLLSKFTISLVTVFCIGCINVLQVELVRRGFRSDLEQRTTVRYKDVVVGEYDGDVIVNDAVLIEIKIAPQYDKRDEAQLLNVLKAAGLKIGILLNFGRYKVEYKRLIF